MYICIGNIAVTLNLFIMTTIEEFKKAIEMVISCSATISCGCEYDSDDAYMLYHYCKHYVDTFDKHR